MSEYHAFSYSATSVPLRSQTGGIFLRPGERKLPTSILVFSALFYEFTKRFCKTDTIFYKRSRAFVTPGGPSSARSLCRAVPVSPRGLRAEAAAAPPRSAVRAGRGRRHLRVPPPERGRAGQPGPPWGHEEPQQLGGAPGRLRPPGPADHPLPPGEEQSPPRDACSGLGAPGGVGPCRGRGAAAGAGGCRRDTNIPAPAASCPLVPPLPAEQRGECWGGADPAGKQDVRCTLEITQRVWACKLQ